MAISERLVHEYQREYRQKFGKDISSKNAEQELSDLATLVRFIAKERRHRHVR